MSQYKVVEAFDLDGVAQEVGSIVELSDEKALELGEKVIEHVADAVSPEAAAEAAEEEDEDAE